MENIILIANEVLTKSEKKWLTAPEIIREGERLGVLSGGKPSAKSVREGLTKRASEDDSLFLRREVKNCIRFGLQKRCKSHAIVSSMRESPKAHNKVGRPRKKKVAEGEEGVLAQPLVNGISLEVSPSPKNIYSPSHMVLYTPPLPSTLTSRVLLEGRTSGAATVLVDGKSPSSRITSSQNVCLDSPTRGILSSMMSLKIRPDTLNQSRKRPMEELSSVGNNSTLMGKDDARMGKDDALMVKDSPLVGKDGTLMGKDDALMVKDSPLVGKDDTLMGKDSPLVDKDSPLVGKDSPLVGKDSPLVGKEGTLMGKDGPLVSKDGTLMGKDDPLVGKDGISYPDIISVDYCHSMVSPTYDISCVRPVPSLYQPRSCLEGEDPCTAQGDRCQAPFEVDPRPPRKRWRCDNDHSLSGRSAADTEATQHPLYASPSTSSTSTLDSDVESNYSEVIPMQSQKLLARPLPTPPAQRKGPGSSRKNPNPLRKNPSPMRTHAGLSQPLPLSKPPLQGLNWSTLSRESSSDSSDSDRDYVDPKAANLRRSREVVKRQRAREKRAAAAAEKAKAAAFAGKPESIKRNLSVLFQPQSLLVNENLRDFINMEAFRGLSDSVKAELVSLLPSVDRRGRTSVSESALSNTFFGAALREHNELTLLGTYTPEFKAKVRADGKKRGVASRLPWKKRFFENSYGDKQKSEESVTSDPDGPYYPHGNGLPAELEEFRAVIMAEAGRKDSAASSLPPLLKPGPCTPPRTKPNCKASSSATSSPSKISSSKSTPVFSQQASSSSTSISTSSDSSQSHVRSKQVPLKKTKSKAVKANKLTGKNRYHVPATTIPQKPPERVRRGVVVDSSKSPSKSSGSGTESSSSSSSQCLSPSVQSVHQSLLELVLRETLSPKSYVSSGARPKLAASRNSLCSSPTTTTQHQHSVYHDHFSTLGSHHVPDEFLSPVKSLPVSVPIEVYRSSASAKQIWREHCYASDSRRGRISKKRPELKLSVPRSVLGPNSGCYKMPLVLCSHCTTLYVSTSIARSTMCPACMAISWAKHSV